MKLSTGQNPMKLDRLCHDLGKGWRQTIIL
jgi:hypothetical protein